MLTRKTLILTVSLLFLASSLSIGYYFLSREVPEIQDDKVVTPCYQYTIYPFPEVPSKKTSGNIGLYIHATNKEPSCEHAVIGYQLEFDNSSNTFLIKLGEATKTPNCMLPYEGGGPLIPSARIILGHLDIGKDYKVEVNACDDKLDIFTLKADSDTIRLTEHTVTNGKLHPNSEGIYRL